MIFIEFFNQKHLALTLTLVLALVRNIIFSKVRVLVLNQPINSIVVVVVVVLSCTERNCHLRFFLIHKHLSRVSVNYGVASLASHKD